MRACGCGSRRRAPLSPRLSPSIKPQIASTSSRGVLLGAWWRKQQYHFPNSCIWEGRPEVMRMPRVHRKEHSGRIHERGMHVAARACAFAIGTSCSLSSYFCYARSTAAARLTVRECGARGKGYTWVPLRVAGMHAAAILIPGVVGASPR